MKHSWINLYTSRCSFLSSFRSQILSRLKDKQNNWRASKVGSISMNDHTNLQVLLRHETGLNKPIMSQLVSWQHLQSEKIIPFLNRLHSDYVTSIYQLTHFMNSSRFFLMKYLIIRHISHEVKNLKKETLYMWM
jgi:hypothetical protein